MEEEAIRKIEERVRKQVEAECAIKMAEMQQ